MFHNVCLEIWSRGAGYRVTSARLRFATSMGLVEYDSDVDSEHEDEQDTINDDAKENTERNERLPDISEKLLDIYQTAPRIISKDPIFHQGRKRTVDHVDGLWPTHVYLEWLPDESHMSKLDSILNEHVNVYSTYRDELGVVRPLHVSVSDTLMIPTDHKSSFLRTISDAYTKSGAVELDFNLQDVLLNQTRSRAFVTIASGTERACNHRASFTSIKEINDSVATRFSLPTLPKDAVPHISIGWYDVSQVEPEKQVHGREQLSFELSLRFETIKVKIGRDVHSISLVQK